MKLVLNISLTSLEMLEELFVELNGEMDPTIGTFDQFIRFVNL